MVPLLSQRGNGHLSWRTGARGPSQRPELNGGIIRKCSKSQGRKGTCTAAQPERACCQHNDMKSGSESSSGLSSSQLFWEAYLPTRNLQRSSKPPMPRAPSPRENRDPQGPKGDGSWGTARNITKCGYVVYSDVKFA